MNFERISIMVILLVLSFIEMSTNSNHRIYFAHLISVALLLRIMWMIEGMRDRK